MMTANKRIQGHPKWYGENAESRTVQSTTLDAEVKKFGLDHINVVKTDTEGLEWEVLLGARQLLRQKKVDLLIYAYEDKWSWDFHTAVEPLRKCRLIVFGTFKLQVVPYSFISSMLLSQLGHSSKIN